MLKEVELVRQKNEITQHYRSAYKLHYGGVAMELSGPDVAALERLVNQSKDFSMLKQVLTHYFEHDTDSGWYDKQAHDIQTFVTNLKKIYAHLLKSTKKKSNNLLITTTYYCDYEECQAKSEVTVTSDTLDHNKDRFIICPVCTNKASRAADKIESVSYVNKAQMRAVDRAQTKHRNSTA